jgi:hypothetical protein
MIRYSTAARGKVAALPVVMTNLDLLTTPEQVA